MSEDPTQENYQHVVAQAKADCEAAGLNLSGSCGAIRITNLTAWRLGYKLLGKAGGTRACLRADMSCVTSGEPGYADGYIIHVPTGYGADILKDAGNTNGPAWQPETEEAERNLKSWKDPLFDPAVMSGEPPTPPGPEPPNHDELEQRVTDLEAAVTILATQAEQDRARMEAINTRFDGESSDLNVHKPLPPYEGSGRLFGFPVTVISYPKV